MPAPAHISPDHDETLIARLAAADLTEPEAAAARELVAACPACAELHADLRSIMAATASLPAPRRTRDFRLTDADATRLRRRGWRRLLGGFGEPRLAFTKPLATGLVTLGIAGLVFALAPSFLATAGLSMTSATAATAAPAFAPAPGDAGAAAGSSQQGTKQDTAASAATSPATSAAGPSTAAASIPVSSPTAQVPTVAGSAAPSGAPTALGFGRESASPSPAAAPPDSNFSAATLGSGATAPAGPSPLLVASVLLLVTGVALFLLRWAARRPG